MSSEKLTVVKDLEFGKRFADACGTNKPAEIERKFGISYHTAKNYLEGRLPSPEMLKEIKSLTGVQIDWLLTGEGSKFSEPREQLNFLDVLDERVRMLIREELRSGGSPADFGAVDEYDIEAGLKKYDNALPVLIEWYAHDHKPAPNLSALAFSGWDKMTLDQKVREVRNLRHSIDEDVEFERQARDALARKSKTS
jgi:transcriptional regulator with XRE-family HTH domain